ncbi:MAG TPA: hypothetical protein VFZ69_07655 [Longimicrobiales bacterium]
MADDAGVSPSRLVLGIGLFVLLGTPLVAYIWETLNRLFAGILEPVRLLIAIPALALFYLLLRFMARTVHAWETARASSGREDR